jgi:hypothetical protein
MTYLVKIKGLVVKKGNKGWNPIKKKWETAYTILNMFTVVKYGIAVFKGPKYRVKRSYGLRFKPMIHHLKVMRKHPKIIMIN